MRSENTPFRGGPLDGRVLPILLGPTGHPPKWYEVPVPAHDGRPPMLHAYRREAAGHTKRLGIQRGWVYEYAPEGRERRELKWPWSKPGGGAGGGTSGGSRPTGAGPTGTGPTGTGPTGTGPTGTAPTGTGPTGTAPNE